jgi:hypothetical protein
MDTVKSSGEDGYPPPAEAPDNRVALLFLRRDDGAHGVLTSKCRSFS